MLVLQRAELIISDAWTIVDTCTGSHPASATRKASERNRWRFDSCMILPFRFVDFAGAARVFCHFVWRAARGARGLARAP